MALGSNGLGGDDPLGGLDEPGGEGLNNAGLLWRNTMTRQHIRSLDHKQPSGADDTADPLGVLRMNTKRVNSLDTKLVSPSLSGPAGAGGSWTRRRRRSSRGLDNYDKEGEPLRHDTGSPEP